MTAVFSVAFGPVLGLVLDAADNEYSLTFVASTLLSLPTLVLLAVLWRQFLKLGGPRSYVAPGDQHAA